MSEANEAQRAYWNSPVGERWAAADATMSVLLAAVIPPILDRAALEPHDDVLDIGCGSGALTVEAARIVAPGHVTGVDLSRPLLSLARERLAAAAIKNADVIEADAQDEAFPGDVTAAVVSRFGAMFFSDPRAAFANLHRTLMPGGRIALAAWGPIDENPWFALPREAAIARLGPPEPTDPRAPGPFAFADRAYFAALLAGAGFADAAVDRVEVMLRHPDFAAVRRLATVIGPASAVLRERQGTEADAAAIEDAIATALAPFREGDGIAIPALLHLGSGTRR